IQGPTELESSLGAACTWLGQTTLTVTDTFPVIGSSGPSLPPPLLADFFLRAGAAELVFEVLGMGSPSRATCCDALLALICIRTHSALHSRG
ncbi:hypothetical protein K7460_29565, partial [Pseudomonas fluorescens]|nr:hypothetical protein [Pseudomonas fluorescens]